MKKWIVEDSRTFLVMGLVEETLLFVLLDNINLFFPILFYILYQSNKIIGERESNEGNLGESSCGDGVSILVEGCCW